MFDIKEDYVESLDDEEMDAYESAFIQGYEEDQDKCFEEKELDEE